MTDVRGLQSALDNMNTNWKQQYESLIASNVSQDLPTQGPSLNGEIPIHPSSELAKAFS